MGDGVDMKDEQFRAVCDPCDWHGEYTDHAGARADALGHDRAAHAGELTAVIGSSSSTIQ